MDEQLLLERVKVASRMALGPQMSEDLKVRAVFDEVTQHLMLELRTWVYAERLKPIVETSTHSHPRSPWQGFKARHWPKFLLRLFPVKQHVVTATFRVDRLRAFPDNSQVFPDTLGNHVALYQQQTPYWEP